MKTSPELPSLTTWADAIEGPLAGATCLWQDLDGIHHEPPTREAPPTHVLWAWTDQTLVRVRLDGNEVFVATLRWPLPAGAGPGVSVIRPLPWAADDKRVAAVRDAGGRQGADVLATRWIVVRDDGLSDVHGDHTAAMGAITFLRPA